MENVSIRKERNLLIIEVDLTKDFGPSSTGKSNIIASTRGFVPVPGMEGAVIQLNVLDRNHDGRQEEPLPSDRYAHPRRRR